MAKFTPTLAEIRFGSGLSPTLPSVESTQQMLARLTGPDLNADSFPIETFTDFRERMIRKQDLTKARRKLRGKPEGQELLKQVKLEQQAARIEWSRWTGRALMRRAWGRDGFRERLVGFWADHFTAQGKRGLLRRATAPYVEDSIRPHITGTFADLVVAATTAPLMLHYLDQQLSTGPNSDKAARRGPKAGLNENLAREVLELHTLGVDGPYTQGDVRELAELFTGMIYTPKQGFKFQKDMAEPGAETVLGVSYGGGKPNIADIRAALVDLANHPATARHIAQKLAVHFVSDTPDPALVDALAARFQDTGGDLLQVYTALLDHPAAWQPALQNVKPPFDFLASAFRALQPPADFFDSADEKTMKQVAASQLTRMGQPWERPTGPDGWPEEDAAWITPQGLAARMHWAMVIPSRMLDPLPDPRDFVAAALGDYAPEPLLFSARAAENRREGVGLVLASPAFQRR